MEKGIILKPYQDSDCSNLRTLCCDSSFLGEPIDKVFCDRELFADLMIEPYLRYEPGHTIIAEQEGKLAGYLTGALSRNFMAKAFLLRSKTALHMLSRWAQGKYASHPRNGTCLLRLLTRGIRENPATPDTPAHFHMNIANAYRGKGIGKSLLNTFENILRRHGYNEYYAISIVPPSGGNLGFYRHMGFEEYSSKSATWLSDDSMSLTAVCIRKKLCYKFSQ